MINDGLDDLEDGVLVMIDEHGKPGTLEILRDRSQECIDTFADFIALPALVKG